MFQSAWIYVLTVIGRRIEIVRIRFLRNIINFHFISSTEVVPSHTQNTHDSQIENNLIEKTYLEILFRVKFWHAVSIIIFMTEYITLINLGSKACFHAHNRLIKIYDMSYCPTMCH